MKFCKKRQINARFASAWHIINTSLFRDFITTAKWRWEEKRGMRDSSRNVATFNANSPNCHLNDSDSP